MRKMLAIRIAVVLLLCTVGLATILDQSVASSNQEKYREIMQDLLTGKIDKPPGAKDYEPPKNLELLPRPAPPIEQDQLIICQDENLVLPMSPGIAAGYQCFIGGRVGARTGTITNLKPNEKEWHVIHQWPTSGENAIVITYFPEAGSNSGVFGIFISALGGYIEWVYFPANHYFYIGIVPNHSSGSETYKQISFLVWDISTNTFWSKKYTLPVTQRIKAVDAALEHDDTVTPNSLWKDFVDFVAYDKNRNAVDLNATFSWYEHPSQAMNNEHTQTFYNNNMYGYLRQRKTPK
ncbi:MAG: hypothetical protein QXZ25_03720 [Candidatus Bathyarchaeia archaeon]